MKLHYLFTDKPLVIIPGVSKPKVGRHFVPILRHGSPQHIMNGWVAGLFPQGMHVCPPLQLAQCSDLTLVLVSVDTLSKGNFGDLPIMLVNLEEDTIVSSLDVWVPGIVANGHSVDLSYSHPGILFSIMITSMGLRGTTIRIHAEVRDEQTNAILFYRPKVNSCMLHASQMFLHMLKKIICKVMLMNAILAYV